MHTPLEGVLHPADGAPTFADEMVIELAQLLGLDNARASLGYKYFVNEGPEILPDVAEFVPMGTDRLKAVVGAGCGPALPAGNGRPVLDSYPFAIGLLARVWSRDAAANYEAFAKKFNKDADGFLKRVREGFDKSARELLKKSALSGLPALAELQAARDQGPEALAALVAAKTPDQLPAIGVDAAAVGLEDFLAALLRHGLDPNAANAVGRTTFAAAEQCGKDSAVYRLVTEKMKKG